MGKADMTLRRVIACLDVLDGGVVKGVQFARLRAFGDPAELAARYEAAGADEIVLLDIGASRQNRRPFFEVVSAVAERLFIPLTVGGGIRSLDDALVLLRAGADKVSINSAGVADPTLFSRVAERVGAQSVVAAIDAKRCGERFTVFTHGGTRDSELEAVSWARACAERGAGELLLTSIDRDGTRKGYDLELTEAVAAEVSLPVIASGGAGSSGDLLELFSRTTAAAALVAGIVHEGTAELAELKRFLAGGGVPVRSLE
jgi:cyclase